MKLFSAIARMRNLLIDNFEAELKRIQNYRATDSKYRNINVFLLLVCFSPSNKIMYYIFSSFISNGNDSSTYFYAQ